MEVSLFIYNNNVKEKMFFILQFSYGHVCTTGHIHKKCNDIAVGP